MAATYNQYAGDGTSRNFAVPFAFMDRAYVHVYVDGVETTAFTWINDGMIQLASAPAGGTIVEVRRVTPTGVIPVDFEDGSILSEDQLDAISKFSAHLAEEARDGVEVSLRKSSTGNFDALSKRITNVASGVSPGDAVTKGQLDAGVGSVSANSQSAAASAALAASFSKQAEAAVLGNFLQDGTGAVSRTIPAKLRELVSVEDFGAVGDNVTNDIEAFVKAMRYSQSVGGCEIRYGGKGRVYRIAYTAAFPAIVIPSGTMFTRVGGGYLRIDPTLLPLTAPAGGSSNWVPAFGEITTGDATTLLRPGAGYAGAGPKDGFIVDNFDPSTACHDIHIVNPKLTCDWVGTLASTQRCYGIRMWFCYDSTVQNPNIQGMPHSGLMWTGGDRNATTGVAVLCRNGTGALPGVSRNGYNTIGILCLNEPSYSTTSHAAATVICHENEDEGFQFANIGQLVVQAVIGKGNRDRLIEGDTSFITAETKALLGVELPNEVIIGSAICDGANSDGGVGKLGISVACGNEGRVTLGNVRIRNIGGVGAPVAVSFTNGGRVSIGDVVLEDCTIPASNHAIFVRAQRVDVRDITAINCTGTNNSALVAIQDADVAYVRGIDADVGFIYGVRFDGTRAARKLSVRDCSPRGLAQAFVYMNLAARAEVVEVIANDADAINSAATVDRGFISIGNASFRCGTLLVEDNRCRVAAVTTQPLTIVGTVSLPVGAIDRARFRRNDFDDEGMFCLSTTENPRCFNNAGGEITDLVDVGNYMPTQRVRNVTAVPTTGTHGKGDTYHFQFPDPGGVDRYRCTTPGTFATLVGVTATVVAGQSTAVLNDASQVVPGSWISIAGVTANGGTATGPMRVVSKTGSTVRFSLSLDQSVSGAAVTNLTPVFKATTVAA